MNKINLYIDIDGVVVPSPAMAEDYVSSIHGKRYPWNVYNYKMLPYPSEVLASFGKFINDQDMISPEGYYDTIDHEISQHINYLADICRVVFVTARPSSIFTLKMLRTRFPSLCRYSVPVKFCDDEAGKVKFMSKQICDRFIEDNLETANKYIVNGTGFEGYLIDAPYNKGAMCDGLHRVSRKDFYKIVESVEQSARIKAGV